MPLNNYGLCGSTIGRCAQPDAQGFQLIRELGYTLIAKLNTDDESSVATETLLFQATAGRAIAQYPNISPLHPDTQMMADIARELIELELHGQRVLIHCTHGRDRTGLVCAAIRLIRDRWPMDQVLEEFAAYGKTILPIYQVYVHAIRTLGSELKS